jgi:hypothetical protein
MPWLPLIIALTISGYTIIDAFGARSGDTLAYYSVCMLCTALCMAPFTLWKQRPTWALVQSELPRAALIGGLSFVSYLIMEPICPVFVTLMARGGRSGLVHLTPGIVDPKTNP